MRNFNHLHGPECYSMWGPGDTELLVCGHNGGLIMYEPKPSEVAKIENSFTYHAPKNNQPKRYEDLRDYAKGLAMMILGSVPEGRERSLAITKLEECVMWANKGIACGE